MKKLILLTSLLSATNCFANALHNFDEIKTAVITGKTIHIVIDFSKCSMPSKQMTRSVVIGAFTPNAIQIVNDHIATSLTHFTLTNPSFPEKPVYEYIKYTITDKNNVNVTHQVLDAANYTSLSNISSFNCKIESGAQIYT
jgi:hypothetical protein